DYKVTECTAPCQRHCPAEIDIPEYIRRISKGDYLGAVRVIREKNPFPLICGWICPSPCEFECRRNLVDEPVSINALKKFVSDYEKRTGERALPTYLPPAEGKKVAVVGGGVEGLTAAYYLRRLGHRPKILEATEKMGGILRYVITEDRLPREVLDWEIDGILDIGVESETNKVMGSDFTLSSLFAEGFEMVLLTTGGWDSRQILMGKTWSGTALPGTYLLLDLLYTFSKGKKKPLGKKTVILGGGKTAVKAANICLDNGAKEVTIVYPYSKRDAESKGVEIEESGKMKFYFSAIPVELQGDGDNLTMISIQTSDGAIEELGLDNLVIGAGRFPEMLFVKTEEEGNKWKTVEIINVLKEESGIGIFSIGETGRANDLTGVVIAVRRGRKIARALQLYASEEEIAPDDRVIIDENELQNVFEITESGPLQAHRGNIDSIMTLTETETIAQAERCLNCGLICYKKELNREKLNAISA
ncbi:MAG: FAD-dependent oxidoreductase, partial [Candidatus Aminicenantes bacterium]|nr:FAD-dependent oxidoreductase [Candidatus Aminicenantes bacterium]